MIASRYTYPQLKSDATVLETQRTWTEVEAQITAARRFYNAAVNALNNAIAQTTVTVCLSETVPAGGCRKGGRHEPRPRSRRNECEQAGACSRARPPMIASRYT